MATLTSSNPTLLDLAKVTDPDGAIAQVVQMLSQQNEILEDMTWQEGNLPTGHTYSLQTAIPTPTWRKFYGLVGFSKSTNTQATANCGMMEMYSNVDKALADLNGNTEAFRLVESMAALEGFNQEHARALFYANEATNPEQITGFAPLFNTINPATSANAENVISAGSVTGGDGRSIWLIGWSPNTVFGVVPKGSKAGIQITNKGQVTIQQTGGQYEAYQSHYRWDTGLCIKDWRYVVRGCNIDYSALLSDAASGGPNLPDLMFQMLNQLKSTSGVRPAFYMSRGVLTKLRQQVANGSKNSTLEDTNVGGKMITSFQGIPIRRVDQLAVNEATIS